MAQPKKVQQSEQSAQQVVKSNKPAKESVQVTVPGDMYPDLIEKRFETESGEQIKARSRDSLKRAQEVAADTMEQVQDKHNRVMQNQMHTPLKRASMSRSFARQEIDKANKSLQKAADKANEEIEELNSEINQELTQHAEKGRFAPEIRRNIKDLDEEKRTEAVLKAINEGDKQTAAAVLGAPAMLSGLSKEQHQNLKEIYRNRIHGDKIKRIKALERALDDNLRSRKILGQIYQESGSKYSIFNHNVIDEAEETEMIASD